MGIKQSELVPVGVLGPTPITPVAKNVFAKAFQFSRSDTGVVLKMRLPAQATILNVDFLGSSNSNAGTTAGVTITVTNNSGTISTGTVNLLTGGATNAMVNMTALPNIEPLPLVGDLSITAQYAETGTASSAGGPWNVVVYFCA